METKADFREKIYCILDFMGDKVKAQNNLMQMMGTSMNSCCITPGMKASLKKSGHPELIRRFLEDVMLSGIREGVLNAEGSLYNRSTSLVSQLMMFLIYLKNEELQTKDSLETVKEQIYQNLLLLNH